MKTLECEWCGDEVTDGGTDEDGDPCCVGCRKLSPLPAREAARRTDVNYAAVAMATAAEGATIA